MPPTHHPPRAGRDPIDGAGPALAMIDLLVDRPLTDQTVALLLGHDRCGVSALVVQGTDRPEHVLDVASTLAELSRREPRLGAIVLASVRATEPEGDTDDRSDLDRWLEMSDLSHAAGVELVEWFIIERLGLWCPRDLLGERVRW